MYHYIEVKLLDNQNNSRKTEQHSKKVPEKKKIFLTINVVIRVIQSLFVFAVVILLLGGALGLGIGMGYFAFLVEDTQPPTKEELQTEISDITEVSQMTYADGTNIAKIKSDLIRTRVDSEHISPLLKKAIISTEDEYFEEHKGVVPKAVIRALVSDATGMGGSSGGSTLTQQLVKQQILTDETTFKRKANEILLAYRIEKYFSKDEIVTTYLNVSPFGRNNKGENIAGVEEAAKGLFGKSANDLTLPQAAFIAGLPQSPIIYTPYSNTGALKADENMAYGMKRKDFVLFSMYREKAITKEEYEAAKNYDLKQDFQPQQESNQNTESYLYNAVLEQATNVVMDINIEKAGVKKETLDDLGLSQYKDQARKEIQNRGYTIQSTIDQTVYDTMQNAVANFGYMLDDGYGAGFVETGNVLMDNKTGKIIGFVAGRDFNVSQSNHALDTVRQVGSTIKPISVYGPAIDQGLIGSESRLANYPTTYSSSGKPLENATNSGTNTFDTVRHSLEWSYNIPVYHLNEAMKAQMGDDNFSYNNYLSKMNYPASDAWAYQSAPLGSVETTVLTQTNGFQALANKGQYQKGYMIDKITDNSGKVIYEHKDAPVRVYSEATASIMNDMMRSVLDSKITTPFKNMVNGLNPAFGNVDWIGKTGTTDLYKDAWLVVSTPTITLGSWTGYDNPTAMSPNSGDQNSAYLANLANAVYSVRPDLFGTGEKFTLSKDVIKSTVSSFTGEKPGTFTYNGGTYTAPGPNVESFYAKDGAPKSQYKFGYGGSDANYSAYWGRYATTPSSSNAGSTTTPSSEKKEDTKKENTTPSSSEKNNN
ncbi:transglycosylase domain-containing protein [Enterococcus sp. DIV0212c]|uniref:transglycosylase domain-containing protein n=1 Tax=Enterococcus sp. DIV0212c TaxID=2230867 RepID=UPI001A9AA443|nr:transglycosylase domain-containing protein [Enterococcus sp. DIV0212c]MBO1355140.1 penicillin-binding protein [Enterococcus sp. DIV0212c]